MPPLNSNSVLKRCIFSASLSAKYLWIWSMEWGFAMLLFPCLQCSHFHTCNALISMPPMLSFPCLQCSHFHACNALISIPPMLSFLCLQCSHFHTSNALISMLPMLPYPCFQYSHFYASNTPISIQASHIYTGLLYLCNAGLKKVGSAT